MKLYEFVDTLNTNGISSFILYDHRNIHTNWFINSTKIEYLESVKIESNDLIIIPEILAERVLYFYLGIRKIIFNQNSFNTSKPFNQDVDNTKKTYLHKDVVQVITVSKYDFNNLKWLFPDINVTRIYLGINDHIFYFNQNKTRSIAVMPRKGKEDYNFLRDILEI